MGGAQLTSLPQPRPSGDRNVTTTNRSATRRTFIKRSTTTAGLAAVGASILFGDKAKAHEVEINAMRPTPQQMRWLKTKTRVKARERIQTVAKQESSLKTASKRFFRKLLTTLCLSFLPVTESSTMQRQTKRSPPCCQRSRQSPERGRWGRPTPYGGRSLQTVSRFGGLSPRWRLNC